LEGEGKKKKKEKKKGVSDVMWVLRTGKVLMKCKEATLCPILKMTAWVGQKSFNEKHSFLHL